MFQRCTLHQSISRGCCRSTALHSVLFDIFTVSVWCRTDRNELQFSSGWLIPRRFIGAISFSRYPGWWFGVSSRSTSHSTMYRRPWRVFFVDIIVPILRSATSRGIFTHILSPGLSFSIVSPPEVGYSASENILLEIDLVYNILYTWSEILRPQRLSAMLSPCRSILSALFLPMFETFPLAVTLSKAGSGGFRLEMKTREHFDAEGTEILVLSSA